MVRVPFGALVSKIVHHAGALSFLVSLVNCNFSFHDALRVRRTEGGKSVILAWIRVCRRQSPSRRMLASTINVPCTANSNVLNPQGCVVREMNGLNGRGGRQIKSVAQR